MKQKITIAVVLTIFISYWSATIFFTAPENYLQIKSTKYQKMFSAAFYQQWSFFAPPPQHNERLYYEFVSAKEDTLTVEVLRELNLKRQSTYLVNDDLSVIDYLLSNSLLNTTDILREEFKNYQFKNCKDTSDIDCFTAFLETYGDKMHSTPEVITLRNYGEQVLKRSNFPTHYEKFRMISTNVPINSFSKRNEENTNEEEFTFVTRYYNLKNKSWEN